MKLSPKEAEEAKKRGQDYEHSMAIEGIYLTPEEKEVVKNIDNEGMGYEEGIQFAIQWLKDKEVIEKNSS